MTATGKPELIEARIKAVRHFCQDQIIHYGKGDSAAWVAQGVVNILDGNIDNQLDIQPTDQETPP